MARWVDRVQCSRSFSMGYCWQKNLIRPGRGTPAKPSLTRLLAVKPQLVVWEVEVELPGMLSVGTLDAAPPVDLYSWWLLQLNRRIAVTGQNRRRN